MCSTTWYGPSTAPFPWCYQHTPSRIFHKFICLKTTTNRQSAKGNGIQVSESNAFPPLITDFLLSSPQKFCDLDIATQLINSCTSLDDVKFTRQEVESVIEPYVTKGYGCISEALWRYLAHLQIFGSVCDATAWNHLVDSIQTQQYTSTVSDSYNIPVHFINLTTDTGTAKKDNLLVQQVREKLNALPNPDDEYVFHACTASEAATLLDGGIIARVDNSQGRFLSEFGRGFYTNPSLEGAVDYLFQVAPFDSNRGVIFVFRQLSQDEKVNMFPGRELVGDEWDDVVEHFLGGKVNMPTYLRRRRLHWLSGAMAIKRSPIKPLRDSFQFTLITESLYNYFDSRLKMVMIVQNGESGFQKCKPQQRRAESTRRDLEVQPRPNEDYLNENWSSSDEDDDEE
jgi:hypothetical protein